MIVDISTVLNCSKPVACACQDIVTAERYFTRHHSANSRAKCLLWVTGGGDEEPSRACCALSRIWPVTGVAWMIA
jgi:hypothetical protein